MAELIILEITSQCFSKKSNVFLSNEKTYQLSTVDDQLMFGVVETVMKQIEKVLHDIKCFIEATSNGDNDTDLIPDWEARKNDIDVIVHRLKASRNTEIR